MKLKLTWDEFVAAAMTGIENRFPPDSEMRRGLGNPSFKQTNGCESDSDAYGFPPTYVEIEISV